MSNERTLTDADVEAIALKVKDLIMRDLQLETGKTVWTWIKRVVIAMLVYAALVGAGVDKHIAPTFIGAR